MLEAPWWAFVVMLLLFPAAIAILVFLHKSLPDRLTFFFTSGLIINHWLHVWCYRLQGRISNKAAITKLNVLFAYSIDWKLSLALGLFWYFILYILLRKVWNPGKSGVTITFISIIGIASIVASQAAASSVPKLGIEIGLLAVYLLGLVSWRYFLSYAPGVEVSLAQIQSDALTSFGLILAFLALWVPASLTFGSFLFRYYQSQGNLGIQLQMTRYAAGIAYSLFGFGIVLLEILQRLIKARGGSFC